MAKRIAPEEVSRFVTLYQSGKNSPEIAEITGRSLRAVCYSLKEAGVELRAEQPHQTSGELEDLALRMYHEGALRSEIAVAAGTNGGTINRILRRRLGAMPRWDDPLRQAKRAGIWGNPDNQPTLTTRETEDRILALYRDGAVTWNEIAAEADCSVKTVANVLERRGVAVSRAFKTTPQIRREIIRLVAGGADVATISEAVNLTEDAVRQFTAFGRESAFTRIDTPEAAYWLGFLTADGAIVGVGPGTLRLQMALARKDRTHLVKLTGFLGSAREVIDYEARTIGDVVRPYTKLICQDRALVMDLIRHGVLPNKTGAEKPWRGPAELMPHFWRGMIDGDGSVPGKAFSVTLVGSYEIVSAFTIWAHGVCGTGINPSKDKRSPNHWRATVGGKGHVPLLLHVLYDDAPVVLDRKKALVDLALQRAAPA